VISHKGMLSLGSRPSFLPKERLKKGGEKKDCRFITRKNGVRGKKGEKENLKEKKGKWALHLSAYFEKGLGRERGGVKISSVDSERILGERIISRRGEKKKWRLLHS